LSTIIHTPFLKIYFHAPLYHFIFIGTKACAYSLLFSNSTYRWQIFQKMKDCKSVYSKVPFIFLNHNKKSTMLILVYFNLFLENLLKFKESWEIFQLFLVFLGEYILPNFFHDCVDRPRWETLVEGLSLGVNE